MKRTTREEKRIARARRIRSRVQGSAERPRLSVSRSLRHVFVQLIDDAKGVTLASASEGELTEAEKKLTKVERSSKVGALLGRKAGEKSIKAVVFDRGGNKYHGRVQAVADAAREAGLEF